jgi:hypothetical protein
MRNIHAIAFGIVLALFGAAPFATPAQSPGPDTPVACCAKGDACCATKDGKAQCCSAEKGRHGKDAKCRAAHGKAGADACCTQASSCCAKADGCCAACKHE